MPYKWETKDTKSIQEVQKELNAQEARGWEFVTMTNQHDRFVMIFRKPMP